MSLHRKDATSSDLLGADSEEAEAAARRAPSTESATTSENSMPEHQQHHLPPPPTLNSSSRSNHSSSSSSSTSNNNKLNQPAKPYGRPVPCEGCREWRRKCTLGTPCQRCSDRGIQCVYLPPGTAPSLVLGSLRRTSEPISSSIASSSSLSSSSLHQHPRPWNPMSIRNIVHGDDTTIDPLHPLLGSLHSTHRFASEPTPRPTPTLPHPMTNAYAAAALSAEPINTLATTTSLHHSSATTTTTTTTTNTMGQPFASILTTRVKNEKTTGSGKPRAAVRAVSCKSCHLRKIKCDKEKPSCSHCVDRKQPCEYYL
ncbi:hypothetical protein CcCBS67573_g09346 [Chytriomyces confervae]|uniref:Zn(2)-C6 fungal-type domain-containing protein n=1 Tax=Chytriomyces confervae TaxID=246404 RepID=A0A507DZ71_9FUNG|nr:hypothetical protein CcCBS67573_g09346 [Chytriomyces confervae]